MPTDRFPPVPAVVPVIRYPMPVADAGSMSPFLAGNNPIGRRILVLMSSMDQPVGLIVTTTIRSMELSATHLTLHVAPYNYGVFTFDVVRYDRTSHKMFVGEWVPSYFEIDSAIGSVMPERVDFFRHRYPGAYWHTTAPSL